MDQRRWALKPLFTFMDFETIGSCNRTCPTCIRNSHPDRDVVASWFETNYLEENFIYDAVEQAIALGYRGPVCLSHYNEPTMDERLPRIARKVRSYPELSTVHFNTNGDFLTPELAAELDGVLDYIKVALYMNGPARAKRATWIPTLFQKTKIQILDSNPHMASHFTPAYDLEDMIPIAQARACRPSRVIINHRQQYLLCCDDMIGNFDLGTFPEISIQDHWFGKRQKMENYLSRAGGRRFHPYCMSCPKGI